MKKFAAALLSAVAMLALCFGLVGCDLFGGGASGLTPADLDGTYYLVSFKDGSNNTYNVGDTYNDHEISESTVKITLRDVGNVYGSNGEVIKNRLAAQISCGIQGHVYQFVGNCDIGKSLTFNGTAAETLNSSGTKVTLTGSYNDGTISLTYNGVSINVKRHATTE